MAEAMRFHVHTLNQMERRQEQMRILDKEIAKGLSPKNFPHPSPSGVHLSLTLHHLPDPTFTFYI